MSIPPSVPPPYGSLPNAVERAPIYTGECVHMRLLRVTADNKDISANTISALRAEVSDLRAEISVLEARLDEAFSSRSWRITAPMRRLTEALGLDRRRTGRATLPDKLALGNSFPGSVARTVDDALFIRDAFRPR